MTGPERLHQLLRQLIGRGRHWRGLQSYLSDQLGAPVRTVQRWTAALRSENKIFTRRFIDSRGYQHMNVYQLVEVDHGGSEVVEVVGGSCSTTTYDRSTTTQNNPYGSKNHQNQDQNHDPNPAPKTRWEDIHVRKIASTTSQPALFEIDRLDERRVTSDNKIAKEVSTRAPKGSPTSRSVTYWLAGRTQRPPGYVVAAVGRAIRECFNLCPELTEQDMRDAIDSLMWSGLDVSPKRYAVACGVLKRSTTQRDYSAQPTWKHLPHRSSMTQQRQDELSARSELRAAASRSRSQTLGSAPSSSTLPGATVSTPTPIITASTVTDSDRRWGRFLLGLPISDQTPGAEPPIDLSRPEPLMIKPTEPPPRTLAEEIEHVRYQEVMGVEASRPSATFSSVLAAIRARRTTGGEP